jgi:hypothetical protein
MPDKVVLDHKMSYLVYFKNFHLLWPIFAQNRKNEIFKMLNFFFEIGL